MTKIRHLGIAGLIALFVAAPAHSQGTERAVELEFPGPPMTRQISRARERADEFYRKREFRRAFFIYRDTLASTGDKYAQYMTGYMLYLGQGTPVDTPTAAAWLRLAAERGEERFVTVRERVEGRLTDAETAEAAKTFAELAEDYGDKAILQKLVREDRNRLATRGGTRVGANVGSGRVNVGGTEVDAKEYFEGLESRLRARELYLEQIEARE